MRHFNEADLIALAQSGDASALGELYDRHHEHIFRYLWSRLGDQQTAEDLTGDVFLRMMTALPKYRPGKASLRAWLYQIARNLLIDHFRKRGNRVNDPLSVMAGQETDQYDPSPQADDALTIRRLEEALKVLEQGQREVVILRFVVGLPLREVAASLNKTEAAVKALQHRGLAALRVALIQEQEQV